MKTLLALLLLSPAAYADCIGNADGNGNVCTTFTLASHTLANGCQNVLAQDGQPAWGSICPSAGAVDVQLQHDPTNPGNELFAQGCASAVTSNTAPPYYATTPQPAGAIVTAFACTTTNYYWDGTTFTDNWTGTYEVDYASVYAVHCSSGRAGYCKRGYWSVQTGGSGQMATPPPPPPPPPPPQPVEYDLTLVPNLCDPAFDCVLQPTDASVVQVAVLYATVNMLYVQNADGSVDGIALDYLSIVPQGDDAVGSGDPIPYVITGAGEVYDPNGVLLKTESFSLNVTQDTQGNVMLTGGTLTVIVQP